MCVCVCKSTSLAAARFDNPSCANSAKRTFMRFGTKHAAFSVLPFAPCTAITATYSVLQYALHFCECYKRCPCRNARVLQESLEYICAWQLLEFEGKREFCEMINKERFEFEA